MKYFGILVSCLCILAACSLPGCTSRQPVHSGVPARIVSLAPSITETLFALGLGESVVGVTRYCTYPAQTAGIAKIGGYADANLEQIILLKPDLVVLTGEHEKQRLYLERFGVRTLTVNQSTISSLCVSIAAIGRICDAIQAADSLLQLFAALQRGTTDSSGLRPRVLFCVGRESPGAGVITSIFVAGRNTFYDELIEAAGGVNAYGDSLPVWPKISAEGILAAAPDLIIDVAPAMGNFSCSLLVKDWQTFHRLEAVKNNQVACMADGYATVPGPRLLQLFAELSGLVRVCKETRQAPR